MITWSVVSTLWLGFYSFGLICLKHFLHFRTVTSPFLTYESSSTECKARLGKPGFARSQACLEDTEWPEWLNQAVYFSYKTWTRCCLLCMFQCHKYQNTISRKDHWLTKAKNVGLDLLKTACFNNVCWSLSQWDTFSSQIILYSSKKNYKHFFKLFLNWTVD